MTISSQERNAKEVKVLVDRNSPFLKSIIINKGSKEGIVKGMPVTQNKYLVGRIVETNYLSSRVLLLNDLTKVVFPDPISPLRNINVCFLILKIVWNSSYFSGFITLKYVVLELVIFRFH